MAMGEMMGDVVGPLKIAEMFKQSNQKCKRKGCTHFIRHHTKLMGCTRCSCDYMKYKGYTP